MILSNQVECLTCGDKPFSAHRHDFKWCKCGLVAVDGGMDYMRRVHNGPFKDISITMSDEVYANLCEQLQWAEDTNRNELGAICAIARTLRDAGYDLNEPRDDS